jgi:hypothetical protein
VPGDTLFESRVEVAFLSDCHGGYDGPIMNVMDAELDSVACLRINDVLMAVVPASRRASSAICIAWGAASRRRCAFSSKKAGALSGRLRPIGQAVLVAKAPRPCDRRFGRFSVDASRARHLRTFGAASVRRMA